MYFKFDIESKIFNHEEMNLIPPGCQSTALHVVEDVITDIWKENQDAKLSVLFTDANVSADELSEYVSTTDTESGYSC